MKLVVQLANRLAVLTGTFVLSTAVSSTAMAQAYGGRNFGPHTGYMSTVEGERNQKVQDMVVFIPPAPTSQPLTDQLFDEKLTIEFVDRYQQKFGYTEQQRAYQAPNSNTYYNDLMFYRGTAEQADGEKRKFAEFMFRRLGEHHFDRIFKNDPKFKAVYQTKQALTTSSTTVSRKFKLSGKYNISSNTADVGVRNPWIDTRIRLEMGGTPETVITLGRPITKMIRAEAHYKVTDGVATVIGTRQITPLMSTSLTLSTYTNNTGTSLRETLALGGFSWVY